MAAPMTGNPTTVPGARKGPPMSTPARWARSPLDYHAHLLLPQSDDIDGTPFPS
jgi:hypothetical protein